jgi:hypothetical protein
MADSEREPAGNTAQTYSLSEAIRQIKGAQAQRDDVVVDMKQAAHARLELLAQDLQQIADEIPKSDDSFDFSLSGGETPRYWIDMTAFVRMGRDPRSYEFVKDTRLGRVLLGESQDRRKIVRMVTNYVAERIIERERAMEGDWLAKGVNYANQQPGQAHGGQQVRQQAQFTLPAWFALLAFLLGTVAGAILIIAWAWFAI